VNDSASTSIIGTSPPRKDGWDKVTGGAVFVDDIHIPGMWVGATVRSPVPRGRIKAIRFDEAFDWSKVVRMTASDLPGPNVVAIIRDDHPILADGEVRFFSEPVALIAAPDEATLAEAMRHTHVEVEELDPVATIEEALKGKAIIWGEDNLLCEYRINRGDVAKALAEADVVVEGEYRTGHQEQFYIEPNGVIAMPRHDGGVEIAGSLQCPYYVQASLMKALGLGPEQAVVRQTSIGGAFGGKEDYPSVLSCHAALLALRAGRPVKMVLERTEDLRSTTKRHPSRVRHRTGVSRDGKLLAMEIDVVLDGGAYTTLSPVVLLRAILHANGAYEVPNASIRGRAVATNTPPNGAFRGFGAPQSLFAAERHMDKIARTLGMDPLELRERNCYEEGDTTPTGQVLTESVGARLVLDRAVELSGYKEKKTRTGSGQGSGRVRQGIGISLFFHGGGFTGGGEEKIAARAWTRFTPEGKVEVLVSSTEMGQGAGTTLCMIAAEALGLPIETVTYPFPDTSRVPDSGPTVASRTTMIVGRVVADASADLATRLTADVAKRHDVARETISCRDGRLFAEGRELESFQAAGMVYLEEHGELKGEASFVPMPDLQWDEENYKGVAYKAYSWGANVVEVEVDMDTLEVRPVRCTAVVEIGRAINPVVCVGQVQGGTLQALGYGCLEEMKLEQGRYLNDRSATYIIPTALDAPDFEVDIAELPWSRGPHGAKGLGELPHDGAAPALAAAVEDATGLSPAEIPVTPEKLFKMAKEKTRSS